MEKKSEKYKNNENATEWSPGWFKRGTPVLATFSALFCSVLVHFLLGKVTNGGRLSQSAQRPCSHVQTVCRWQIVGWPNDSGKLKMLAFKELLPSNSNHPPRPRVMPLNLIFT